MQLRIISLMIEVEQDIVSARQRAREVSAALGFHAQDQTRIATAISELARNAYEYAKGGKIEFLLEGDSVPQILTIVVKDDGPGIAELDVILQGRYRSQSGMGVGLLGVRRLLDRCQIDTVLGQGTSITVKKILPAETPYISAERLGTLMQDLTNAPEHVTLREVKLQNAELLSTLAELNARQEELLQLTRELENTNRGVVALYAELDEKADHLRRADEMKSRFLSNMSHEFRTPLSSIRALSKLMLERIDGELTEEQELQMKFILKGAEDLAELVDDLLDLAKIEAGKTEMHIASFDVRTLFGTLQGMLRPLLVSPAVDLVFDAPSSLPLMASDEGKISQILRNLISNALKFTEQGHVKVSARVDDTNKALAFSVEDTGIGIAKPDQQVIFEEFGQVQGHLQRRVKGTGLGLPLCKKLAGLLGGAIHIESTPGQGSTFTAIIPLLYEADDEDAQVIRPCSHNNELPPDSANPILFIEDHAHTRLLYEKLLRNSAYHPITVPRLRDAEELLNCVTPKAVVLDIILNGQASWHWLASFKQNPRTADIPVIIVSEVDDRAKALALGANAYFVKPIFKEELMSTLQQLVHEEERN